ncbi:cytochrome P450 [Daedaleopsis nitida]|nr:cytochrome P450 [Daedaleopsis nitida]
MSFSEIIPLLFVFSSLFVWIKARRTSRSLSNIPGPPSALFLKGNMPQLLGRHSEGWTKELIDTYGSVCTLYGPYGSRWLHVYDPKALYSIAIKDQDSWCKSAGRFNELLIGPGLLTTEGAQHRKQRKMLTPVFSAAYLRNITCLFYETSYALRDAIAAELEVKQTPTDVDVIRWTSRAALELLGQGALGYSFDPLVSEDVDDSFPESVKSYFAECNRLDIVRNIVRPVMFLGPAWLRRMVVEMTPMKRVQRLKRISDTMYSKSIEVVKEKKSAIEKVDDAADWPEGDGKDIMSILLKANMAASDKEKLSDEEVIAQVSTFVLAGMDTTSNATARLLHLLALKPEVQTELRNEIVDAQAGEGISYDQLMELPFLDAVCRETLRLYGPIRILSRRALEDTTLPLHEHIRGVDGSLVSEVSVPKGTIAILNLWACNTNKALWGEDAHEWKPERWLAPLPQTVEDARIPGVYSNLMSFHGGGRSCIGFKYAQLELKVMLAVLLTSFCFEMSDKPIVWNYAGVAYPTIGKTSTKPEMPLRVSRLQN